MHAFWVSQHERHAPSHTNHVSLLPAAASCPSDEPLSDGSCGSQPSRLAVGCWPGPQLSQAATLPHAVPGGQASQPSLPRLVRVPGGQILQLAVRESK